MSVPPVGYFDVYENGKVVSAFQSPILHFNKDAIDLSFGFNAARDTSKINVLAFDYDFRSETAPFEYKAYDAPGVTLVATDNFGVSIQGDKFKFTSGATLKEIDMIVGTSKNDTFIMAMNGGPEVLATGDGNDLVIDNHTLVGPIGPFSGQRMTSLGDGADTFISNDNVADLVIAQDTPYDLESDTDTIVVSKGSLVIAGANDKVTSATGNMDDIKVMSIQEFGQAFISDPLGFLRDHSTLSPMGGSESKIDAGLILAAAQEILVPLFPNLAYGENGIIGVYSPSGEIIPGGSDFGHVMQAFRLAHDGDTMGALKQLAEVGLDTYEEAYPLLRAMTGVFDQSEGYKLGVPLPVTPLPHETSTYTLDAMPNCTAYATYEQFGYPDEDVQTIGYSTAYTPEIF